jgi:hypothetical protein
MPVFSRATTERVQRSMVSALSVLALLWSSDAYAQKKYEEVACSAVPVTGFDFKQCWQSDVWRNGIDTYVAYRLTVVTPDSRVTIGYGKPTNGGFWAIVRENDLVNFYLRNRLFRGNLFPVTNVGDLEKHGQDFFFSFEPERPFGKEPFRCKAFVRPGPWKNARALLGGYEYMSGGFFCRASPSPIETQEVRFFTDKLTFR